MKVKIAKKWAILIGIIAAAQIFAGISLYIQYCNIEKKAVKIHSGVLNYHWQQFKDSQGSVQFNFSEFELVDHYPGCSINKELRRFILFTKDSYLIGSFPSFKNKDLRELQPSTLNIIEKGALRYDKGSYLLERQLDVGNRKNTFSRRMYVLDYPKGENEPTIVSIDNTLFGLENICDEKRKEFIFKHSLFLKSAEN